MEYVCITLPTTWSHAILTRIDMAQAPTRKEWAWIAIGIVAVVVLVFILHRYYKNQELAVTTYAVPATSVPTLFPADIPLEENTTILENYAATTSDGRLQSTRSFESAQSLEANSVLYQEYFIRNGWTIEAFKNEDVYKAILVAKGDMNAQIVLTQDAEGGHRTVQITMMTTQPADGAAQN